MKIRLREIRVVDLNSKTVILLTQFVRMARVKNGVDIKMQYPDVVRQVFYYGAVTQSPELIVLLKKIRRELIRHVRATNLEKPSFNVYAENAYA